MRIDAIGLLLLALAAPTSEDVGRLLEEDRYAEAVPASRALLEDVRARYGRESREAGNASIQLVQALIYSGTGTFEERKSLATDGVAISRRLLDDGDPALAEAIYLLGLAHNLADQPREALPHFEEALGIAERSLPESHYKLRGYVREYGTALYAVGRYTEAKVVFQRHDAMCKARYGKGDPATFKAILNLALVHKALGEFREAEERYKEMLAMLEAQPVLDVENFTWGLNSYANLLGTQGRLREAREQSERVLELRRRYYGDESEKVAWTLNDLAFTEGLLGDYEGARAHLEESLLIQGKVATNSTLALKSRISLARNFRLLGLHDRSRGLFDEVAGKLGQGEQSVRGEFHSQFGSLLTEMGDFAKAREQFEQALRDWESTVGRESYDFAEVSSRLGDLDLREGRASAAKERLESALATFEHQVGQAHPKAVETQGLLAAAYYARGEAGPAFTAAVAADRGAREVARATLAFLPERQALAQAALPRHGRDVAVTLALAAGATEAVRSSAYDTVLLSRALVFDEIAERNRFYGTAEDTRTTDLAGALRDARTRLASLYLLGPVGDASSHGRQLNEIRREIERLEGELAGLSAAFRSRRSEREFDIDALRKALPDWAVCVSFLRYARHEKTARPRASYAAIVQAKASSAPPTFVDLGAAETLEQAIASWREALSPESVAGDDSEARYRRIAEGLRRTVWDPIAAHVQGAKFVFIVPDGAVNLVSFAALPVDDRAYLIESGPALHYLSAERDLAPAANAESASGELLVLANPAFDDRAALAAAGAAEPATLRSFRTMQFGALPGAADEARAVETVWRSRSEPGGDSRVLVGEHATEAAFRSLAPRSRVIHLATHGYFLEDRVGSAAEYRGVGGLAPRDAPVTPNPSGVRLSPLLASGLALAGANRRGESRPGLDDGILTAEELSTLPLGGVELAVLSACRTGAGSVTEGEGLFGLRRALLVSGVRTVVTNLWDVEDRSARSWIEQFYRQRFLASRKTIPEAMRGASLGVLEARRRAKQTTHPFFWGGWLAVGAAD